MYKRHLDDEWNKISIRHQVRPVGIIYLIASEGLVNDI